ncbi:MAG: tetratricopeptide repeat protein [Acidobacteriota bacterium]
MNEARRLRRVWYGLALLTLLAGAASSLLLALKESKDNAYVGDEACKGCHATQYESFRKTSMGRSMTRPDSRDPLGDFARPFEFYSQILDRHYAVFKRQGKYFHRESQKDSSGKTLYSDTREVKYSVGSGRVGRSYLIADGNRLYMSPISFYTSAKQWDLSPGYENKSFHGFNRPVWEQCVVCHAGLAKPVRGGLNLYLDPPFQTLAIGCERCHGPGQQHAELNRSGEVEAAARAIVNPRKLPKQLRDNVCDQCHLRGDARVLRPGRSEGDFRPGQPLDETIAIFSVPLQIKGERGEVFPGISHVAQIRSSSCWKATAGELACTTCHDPHQEPRATARVDHYKSRCLTCHKLQECAARPETRHATSPPDNCVGCHMPKSQVVGIAHAVATDHRIRRSPQAAPGPAALSVRGTDLVYETAVGQSAPDLRTRALAYAQLSLSPSYRQSAYELLEQAAREYPDDRDVQESFGLTQLRVSSDPASIGRAAQALQRAVALGTPTLQVYLRLAEIRLSAGQVNPGIRLLEQALELEPRMSSAALRLSEVYLALGQPEKARTVLVQALKLDPGNSSLREALK